MFTHVSSAGCTMDPLEAAVSQRQSHPTVLIKIINLIFVPRRSLSCVFQCSSISLLPDVYYPFARSATDCVIMVTSETSSLGHSSPTDWTVRIRICWDKWTACSRKEQLRSLNATSSEWCTSCCVISRSSPQGLVSCLVTTLSVCLLILRHRPSLFIGLNGYN
jgi:hypothetical protein